MMLQYDQYRVAPSRQSKQGSVAESERRAPIKPRESMKDILYNNVGVGMGVEERGSRVQCDISSVVIIT